MAIGLPVAFCNIFLTEIDKFAIRPNLPFAGSLESAALAPWHNSCDNISTLGADFTYMINFPYQIAVAALSACALSCAGPQANQPTVRKLDAARYSGEWHEIARLPNPFEKNLVAAKAIYQVRPDGTLSVRNEGLKDDGTPTSITGTARQPEPRDPGKLLVRFDKFPANFFEGDYWILDTDASYTHALVGSPGKKFLWLLSKNPSDGRKEFSAQIQKAHELGYATGQLYFNPKRIDE